MAEIDSRSAAKIAANTRLSGAEGYGKQRSISIVSPATYTLATNDILGSGVKLPIGTRFLGTIEQSNAAMSGVSFDVGLRNFKTKVAIDADGLVSSSSAATAGTIQVATADIGVLIDDGVEFITEEETEIFLTVQAGTPAANAQFRFTVSIVTDD